MKGYVVKGRKLVFDDGSFGGLGKVFYEMELWLGLDFDKF